MKPIYFAILCIASLNNAYPAAASSQQNNIYLFLGDYHFYNVSRQFHTPWNLIGLKYTRQVRNHIYVFANTIFTGDQFGINHVQPVISETYNTWGTLETKLEYSRYSFYDIGLSYRWEPACRHFLSLGIGPSFAYGKNNYIQYKSLPPSATGGGFYHTNEYKWKGYFGGQINVSYDYELLKSRINIGAEAITRYYAKDLPFSINYGLHIGYNFSFRAAKNEPLDVIKKASFNITEI